MVQSGRGREFWKGERELGQWSIPWKNGATGRSKRSEELEVQNPLKGETGNQLYDNSGYTTKLFMKADKMEGCFVPAILLA